MLTPVTIVTADAILAMSSITALNGFRNYGKTLDTLIVGLVRGRLIAKNVITQ